MTINNDLPDGPGFDRLCRDVAAAKPFRLVAKAAEISQKCPLVKTVEFSPCVVMDMQTSSVRIKSWDVWLWGEQKGSRANLVASGDHRDLDTAIAEAIDEYNAVYGPTKSSTQIESDNAAALEDVERFGDDGPCCGGGSQCRCGGGE